MNLLSFLLLTAPAMVQVPSDSLVAAIFAAEQARARTVDQLGILTRASQHPDSVVQRLAVRALGRLERAELLDHIVPVLRVSAATVRIEAANAVAQATYRVDGIEALAILTQRLGVEQDPLVRGALLSAIGRLRLGAAGTPAVREAQALLTRELERDGDHRAGALRGTWEVLRKQGRAASADAPLVAALRRHLAASAAAEDRRLALMALAAGNAVDSAVVAVGFADTDPQVRRLALLAARTGQGTAGRNRVFAAGLNDPEVMVRIEAVRGWAMHGRASEGCEPLIAATRDASITVQLLAIEGLGAGCGAMTAPRDLLEAITREPVTPTTWHRPMRALAALAATDSARAGIRLGSFSTHAIWWVRMHAAAVAQQLGDRASLLRLLEDPEDNVREAALRGVVAVEGRAADRHAVAQLARRDYQLVLSAARALRGSSLGPDVATASLAAFLELSRDQVETSRDTRMALLDRVSEFGTPGMTPALSPALRDIDPLVAARAAEIIAQLTGQDTRAEPVVPAPGPLPALDELRSMTAVTLVFEDGTRLALALRPLDAPGSVARFMAMAQAGWYDGLTLHRVVPNFVLQGGSPAANEYRGGSAFSRDEVGASHRRGTIGISTRGRDTGDGQLFINLVDNLNLDHEYTVIGEVVGDLRPIDRIMEGAVILRVELPTR